MLRNGRVIAPVLATLAMSFVVACASQTDTGTLGSTAPAGVSTPRGSEPVVLTGATLMTDGENPRLLLSGNGPLAATVFPRGDGAHLVVDLPNTVVSPGLEPPRSSGGLLTQVAMKSFVELGRPHVQFELTSRSPLETELGTVPGSTATAVTFLKRISHQDEPALVSASVREPAPIQVETLPVRSEPASADSIEARTSISSAPIAVSSAPVGSVHHAAKGRPATRLNGVTTRNADGGVIVRLDGDGSFEYEAFALTNPPRYVVDLSSVRNTAKRRQVDLQNGPVSRVRFSQFKTAPQPVTRVVFDLAEGDVPTLTSTSNGLSLAFRHEAATAAFAPHADVVVEPVASAGTSTPAAVPVPASESLVASAAPASGSYERHETEEVREAVVGEKKIDSPVQPSTILVESMPAPAASASSSESAPTLSSPSPRLSSQVVASSPEVRVASPAPVAHSSRKKKTPNSEDRALIEAAEALLVQQEGGVKAKDLINPYESRTMGGGEKPYTGEPITLNLKDADIKDTLQKFSELTGLNIVLDPDVRGTVTVSLTDIPWDQALELILKINNLGYVLEGNVMRISSTAKLAQEETNRVTLIKAQEANRPVKTVIQKLSYAKADDTATTARKIMSVRGDIFVDERSNTLIIKELPDYLPTVLDLIRNLDVPTPQVMIEARVVEATRSFLKQLGVDWGLNGRADQAHGNTTGLVFPNSGSVGGAVSLPSGNQLLKLSLANVLDTIRLDFALSAAESRGLLKIVSTPKVQTQTNQIASIQSGFQIPVQTTVNNTTSVLYIDATLRLDVTPQITAEGTIIMDVKVQKREPAVALNIAIGNNIPLITRDAKTRLMVRDGGTAVIGGIFKFTTNDSRSMIPGLWKIPLLGNLFRNRVEREDTDELMIFITPRIMKN